MEEDFGVSLRDKRSGTRHWNCLSIESTPKAICGKILGLLLYRNCSNPKILNLGHTLKSPRELSKMLRLVPTTRRTSAFNWIGMGKLPSGSGVQMRGTSTVLTALCSLCDDAAQMPHGTCQWQECSHFGMETYSPFGAT